MSHRRTNPLASYRSLPRVNQRTTPPLAAQSPANPRPARTLHHRQRVPPPTHPLPPHRRKTLPKKLTAELHRSLRSPPRPYPGTRRSRHLSAPRALQAAQPPRRAATSRPDLGQPRPQLHLISPTSTTTSNQQTYWVPRGAFFQINRFLLPELLNSSQQPHRPVSLRSLRRSRPLLPRARHAVRPGHRGRDRQARLQRSRLNQTHKPPRRQSHHSRLPPRRRPRARASRPRCPRSTSLRCRPRGLRATCPHRRAHAGLCLLLAGDPPRRPHHSHLLRLHPRQAAPLRPLPPDHPHRNRRHTHPLKKLRHCSPQM